MKAAIVASDGGTLWRTAGYDKSPSAGPALAARIVEAVGRLPQDKLTGARLMTDIGASNLYATLPDEIRATLAAS